MEQQQNQLLHIGFKQYITLSFDHTSRTENNSLNKLVQFMFKNFVGKCIGILLWSDQWEMFYL